jgi:transposase
MPMPQHLQTINARLFANVFRQYLDLSPRDRHLARDAVARYHGGNASTGDRAEALESLRAVLHPAAGPAIEAHACLAIAAHDERDC